jgi:hypothetical protein
MEQTEKPTYNGWANYQTWAVNLWLMNEQASYTYWGERTRAVLGSSEAGGDRGEAVRMLADELRDALQEECTIEKACLAADLMTAILEAVDWQEIAASFVEDFGPSQPQKVVPLGLVVATPGALAELTEEVRTRSLARHARGDWGDTGPEDWAENELSLAEGFRLLSVYHTPEGLKFWVITEADRSVTTILLPDEY